MSIVQQPVLTELSAYGGEAFFRFEDIILTSLGTWKQAVIVVTNTATGETTTIRKAPRSTTILGLNTEAIFQIDVSNIIQTYFCTENKNAILTTIGGFAEHAEPLQPVFRLDVAYEYVDAATGLIATSPTTDTTNDFTVLNATFQNDSLPFLAEYTQTPGRLFLTRAPRDNKVCLDDNAILTFWIDGINALRVIETPKSGPTSNGIIDITNAITSGTIQSATVGPVGINAAAYVLGGVVVDQNTRSYTVEAGAFVLGVFTPVTEPFTFSLIDCCPSVDCRLYWLNSLGGYDSYLFNGNLRKLDIVESARYDKPLAVQRQLLDYGPAKFDSRKNTQYEALSRFLCDEDANWLREVQSQIVVCKQITLFNQLRVSPVLVLDTENVIEDRDQPGITRAITFIDSDPLEVQQYG